MGMNYDRELPKTYFSLWIRIMQKTGLWREKVEKSAKIPEMRVFYPRGLWKTPWIMGKNPVETVDEAVICALHIHRAIFIQILPEL